MHTTNYQNTFIEISEDCPAKNGEVPPEKEEPTIAKLQYDLLINNPYRYTSDDVIFYSFAKKTGIPEKDYPAKREEFFSRGQACMRSSPLTKRYGWGIHNDQNEKMAIYPAESEEYKKLAADPGLEHKKAMRSKKG